MEFLVPDWITKSSGPLRSSIAAGGSGVASKARLATYSLKGLLLALGTRIQ